MPNTNQHIQDFAGTKTLKSILKTLLVLFILNVPQPSNAQVSTDSLLLYMPFNGDALDYSGNENHGILNDVVADTNRFGATNSSYKFNGVDSYIEIPASPSMNMIQTLDEVSITAWININQWHVSGNVFSIFERYSPGTDSGWLLEANWVGGGILFLADETGPTNWIGCDFTWNFDQWYHLGFTYSQAQQLANFYINGELVCSETYSPPINVADTTSSFIIGRSLAGPDEYSDGLIDDYKIYNRILSAAEVDTSFTLGRNEAFKESRFEMYPNPTNEMLTILAPSNEYSTEYKLIDLRGRVRIAGAFNSTVNTIDMTQLPSGIYMLVVNDENITTKKIIKTN